MQASTVEKLLMKDMAERVKITTEEIIEARLTIKGSIPEWNRELPGRDFLLSEAETALLKKKADQLDKAEAVTDLSLELVQRLLEPKKE
jgi:hypothetical protein